MLMMDLSAIWAALTEWSCNVHGPVTNVTSNLGGILCTIKKCDKRADYQGCTFIHSLPCTSVVAQLHADLDMLREVEREGTAGSACRLYHPPSSPLEPQMLVIRTPTEWLAEP